MNEFIPRSKHLLTNMKKKFQPFIMDAGSCLYAHIVICNIINDIITLRKTSVSNSQVFADWMPFLPP